MRHLFLIVVSLIAVVTNAQATTESVLPSNVEVPGVLVEAVSKVYAQSGTFRAQCQRLSQAQGLRVSLTLDVYIPSACRAFTIIRRRKGLVCAEVHLPPSTQFAELIAHEFEHIIEQLEYVNLRALARVRGSGVREVGFELFETDRAQESGRIVAMEMVKHHDR
jgi:hypothetical protein